MTHYFIFIRSSEHPRTINTPRNGRTWYTKFEVFGREALAAKVAELREAGEFITDIRTAMGHEVYV